MLKKTVTYPGFEGDELVDKKKDIYFDIDIISAAKLMGSGFEKKLSSVQTRAQEIENAVKTKTMDENEGNIQLLEMFSDIFEPFFEVAYNERRGDDLVNKDEDGAPLFKKFMNTKGYTALLIDLVQDPDAVAKLIEGAMPKNFQNNPQYQAALKAVHAQASVEA